MDAINEAELKKRNIKYLVTAIHGMPQLMKDRSEDYEEQSELHAGKNHRRTDGHGKYIHQWWVRVPVLDREEASIMAYFDAMNEWIHNRIGDELKEQPQAEYIREHNRLRESGIDSFPFVCTVPSHLHETDFDSSAMVDTETDTTATTTALSNDGSQGAVLVHCIQGKSRSATLVIAYLMWSQQMTFRDAMAIVKERRSLAEPNSTFKRELLEYEEILRKRGHYELVAKEDDTMTCGQEGNEVKKETV